MGYVSAWHALGDTRYGILAKFPAQGSEHIDFTLFAKLIGRPP
jgi:hypothetical protein